MRIIGVDFSSSLDNPKTGLARATASGNGLNWQAKLECVQTAKRDSVVGIVKEWLDQTPALIAIDAPLGWPDGMRMGLPWHTAGRRIRTCDKWFFRRKTDRRISEDPGKDPLEVGANLIARTAYWALQFLGDLRRKTGRDIPLAWDRESVLPISVIEVYPAATLKAHSLRYEGYKGADAKEARTRIVNQLVPQLVEIDKQEDSLVKRLVKNDDMLDAAVCVLAALDFLRGAARPPEDRDEAKREGWIWCKGIAR